MEQHWTNLRTLAEGATDDALRTLNTSVTEFQEDEWQVKALEEHIAHTIICKAHHHAHQQMKEHFAMQFAGGNDRYP